MLYHDQQARTKGLGGLASGKHNTRSRVEHTITQPFLCENFTFTGGLACKKITSLL